jgi:cytochrome c oxidase cbb3-type subunit 4
MDVNTLRAIVTVAAFVSFVGIAWWAYSRSSRPRFDEAANLPFADEAHRVVAQSQAAASPGVREDSRRAPVASD